MRTYLRLPGLRPPPQAHPLLLPTRGPRPRPARLPGARYHRPALIDDTNPGFVQKETKD